MELHDKYGVPNIETARELAWDKETNFYWVVYNGETFLHSKSDFHKKVLKEWEEQCHLEWDESDKLRKEAKTPLERKPFWLNERYHYGKIKVIEEILHSLFGVKEDDLIIKNATDWLEAEEIEFIPAPQMHELLLYLPSNVSMFSKILNKHHVYSLYMNLGSVRYEHIYENHFLVQQEIINYNFAQAISKVFIELRNGLYLMPKFPPKFEH